MAWLELLDLEVGNLPVELFRDVEPFPRGPDRSEYNLGLFLARVVSDIGYGQVVRADVRDLRAIRELGCYSRLDIFDPLLVGIAVGVGLRS